MEKYDFSGWATKVNLKCSDGLTIMKDAFKHNDGKRVPLVWNHTYDSPENVLGHALLENRDEGVYAYCKFNDTESANTAKLLIQHGDINALSIYANKLKKSLSNVIHGDIREVSLVLAGANPGAFIETQSISHGDEETEIDEAVIYSGEELSLIHGEDDDKPEETLSHADDRKETKNMDENKESEKKEKTIEDVINSMSEEQKNVLYYLVEKARNDNKSDDSEEGGNDSMTHNVFENDETQENDVLTHSDMKEVIKMAKNSSVGSFRNALNMYIEDNDSLKHGFVDEDGEPAIDQLFPDYKDVRPGAPEFIEKDQGWVNTVMNKVHKSPISRIRTRQADITGSDLRAYGHQKGDEKHLSGDIKLLKRTTDPQTVYRKDSLHRDDILDITEFDVVEYQYRVMKQNMNEELATAIMIGDGRDDASDDKISEEHIRSIWHDDELYTIHVDVDVDAAREELQGTDTAAHFGDNYVYAEAIITAALYARENYKGSGSLDFYCTPHLVNVMLLARDMNGRRIFDSISDLAKALNVNAIYTAEQFADKTRNVTVDGSVKTKKLLGTFVNLSDYQVGSTKGGEITRFEQFDIDFNKMKYLIETRLSGALTRIKSAIVLEEDVTEAAG